MSPGPTMNSPRRFCLYLKWEEEGKELISDVINTEKMVEERGNSIWKRENCYNFIRSSAADDLDTEMMEWMEWNSCPDEQEAKSSVIVALC